LKGVNTLLRYFYNYPNNNSSFLIKLASIINIEINNEKIWAVGSLVLTPKFHGDYPPAKEAKFDEIAHSFAKKVEKEGIVYASFDEIQQILQDTQYVREGVFICLPRLVDRSFQFFPLADVEDVEEIQHPLALVEIRVIDGDIFEVLIKDLSFEEEIRNKIDKLIEN
jgi:hypothetical protein